MSIRPINVRRRAERRQLAVRVTGAGRSWRATIGLRHGKTVELRRFDRRRDAWQYLAGCVDQVRLS